MIGLPDSSTPIVKPVSGNAQMELQFSIAGADVIIKICAFTTSKCAVASATKFAAADVMFVMIVWMFECDGDVCVSFFRCSKIRYLY